MITLVYGLGFGMLLVLLVVPALIAVQRDVARPMAALRRALRGPSRGLRGLVAAVSVLILAWLAATLGAVVLTGALPAPVLTLVPALAAASPLSAALALFTGGALALVAAAYLGAVLADARASARRA